MPDWIALGLAMGSCTLLAVQAARLLASYLTILLDRREP